MKSPAFFYLFAMAALACVSIIEAKGKQALTLVRDGKPCTTIVLAAKPTRATQLAAFELQWHVQQMTGATLPIVHDGEAVTGVRILIGASDATSALRLPTAPFAPQQYQVTFLPDTLVLMGKDKEDYGEVKYDPAHWEACWNTFPDFWDEQGTLYATYDLLEKYCGVRWLDPTETGTVIPRKTTLIVQGQNIDRAPFMLTRNALVIGNNEAYDASIGLWTPESKEYKEYEALAYQNLHTQYPDANQYLYAKRAKMRLYQLRMRAGGEKSMANHSLYMYYDRYWEANAGHPIFEVKRPELFAKGYQGQPPQLCYTSPELIAQVVKDARSYFDNGGYPAPDAGSGVWPVYHWGERFFTVEPMDNSSFCKCENCRKFPHEDKEHTNVFSTGTDSDYFFSFVNKIAGEIKQTHPSKTINTLAYGSHAWPPTTFRLADNVAVHFCFSANRMVYDVRDYRNELAALKAWRTQYPRMQLYLWNYDTFPLEVANNGRWHCFPGFFAHKIGEQFKLFQQYNIRGIFHCGYGQQVEAYVSYKLMDDPSLNVDTLLDEYFTGLYGTAAKPMRQLYEGIEATYCDPKNYPKDIRNGERGSHQTVQFAWEYLGTRARMAKFQQLMDDAKAQANTVVEKTNVELFEKAVWSYMVSGKDTYTKRMEAPIPAVKAPQVAAAGGDVAKVEWAKAAPLGDGWFDRGGDTHSARKFAGRICHDSQNVYLELTDPCDTARLVASSGVNPYDDWELFVAGHRALPYRQICFGPTELLNILSHGEVNWRTNVPMQGYGVKITSDKQPDKWVSRVVLPLTSITATGIAPTGTFYMNIIRVTSPALTGSGSLGIDTWVPYCTVHEVDRLAEITLE